jgi:hypothetical protein
LETSVNELFEVLFNMSYNATLYVLFVPRLDFGERLELIRIGLGRRGKGISIGGLIVDIREFLEVRNIIAHSPFVPDDRAGDRGVVFDYLGRSGKAFFSDRVRKRIGGEQEDSFISYDAFADLDRRMKNLTTGIRELAGASEPLSDEDFDEETVKRMTDVLNRNVIPVDPPPRKKK